MKKLRISTFICLLTLGLMGTGCGSAMLSDEHLAKQAKGHFAQMKKSEKLSRNASHKAMINRIGRRISGVAQIDLPGTEWEFVVFDKKEPNAFAMPGGKVGVNSGLITLARGNEDEVAAVIGHEIAHVAFRHSNKRMSQAIGISLGGVILETAMRNKSGSDRMLARGAYGVGTAVGLALPFSRSQEREADHRGLYYAAMAGYDPRASISFWEKMQKAGGGKVPEFLSTHPDSGKRIEFLQSNMDHAMALYREAKQARGEKPNP
jgi:metalloendopeptidase OMA1, mitochondrial